MADAQKLIDKIISDAQRDAQSYWQEAEQKKRELKEKTNRAIEKRKAEIERMANDAIRENQKRLEAVYDLEHRKQLLAAKQEIMAATKARALDMLCSLDKAAYLKLMRQRLLACAPDGEGGIVISANEKHIDAAFISEVNSALHKATGKGAVALLPQKRDMRGGFVYINGGLEIDVSLEALLEEIWQQQETAIAAVLFE